MPEAINETPRRPDVYNILKAAVSDGLVIVRKVEGQDLSIDSHDMYPDMSYYDPGFPRFSYSRKEEGGGPKNYGSVFTDHVTIFNQSQYNSGSIYLTKDIPSWQAFWNLANEDEYLKRYWEPHEAWKGMEERLPGSLDHHKSFTIFGTIRHLLDRYIHVTKEKEFKQELFKPIYLEWERAVFESRLYFDILVPIIRLKFSFDELQLGGGLAIERMSDGVQLSRGKRRSSNMSAHDDVIVAATHALVLKNWMIENGPTREDRSNSLHAVDAYSDALYHVDNFFAALRAVTGVETGYCQILARPIDWADSWEADLPPINICSVRAYPDQFEKISWMQEVPELDAEVCLKAGKLYDSLAKSSSNRL